MVPESVAVEYLDKVWRTKEKERDWKRVDMDWFSAVLLKSTEHHKQRAINDERDPAKACRRIQKQEGHHSKFGPPFMSFRIIGSTSLLLSQTQRVPSSLH